MSKRFVTFALLLVVATAACSRTTVEAPSTGLDEGLFVTGVGRVEASPDTLVISMGVTSVRPTAGEALAAASETARAIIQAIKAGGVEDRDIRTSSLSLRPEIDSEGAITGFVASETFRISIRDLEKSGEIVGAAVAAGGDETRISAMALEVGDPEELKDEARTLAVEDATRRAGELAAAAGVDLGPAISIREAPGRFGAAAFGRPLPLAELGAAAAADLVPQIEPGTKEIVVRVDVVFRILEG